MDGKLGSSKTLQIIDNQVDCKVLVQLIWENICYSFKQANNNEQVLKDVNGVANPGELLVMMGSSGAGKTTLLNILAGRLKTNKDSTISGTVKINGLNVKDINYGLYSAYVTQEDILLPTLTPRESFMFSSKLRLPGNHQEHVDRVNKLLSDLQMEKTADNIIGSVSQKGLSGGERKRVCIGMELITEPCVLLLDEPTSGLDSYTAAVVIDLLLKQAKRGRTVITTIHQPSSDVFDKFDRLILMSEGYIVYQGPAVESRKHFAAIGYKCPKLVNPADYYMRILHVTNRHEMTDEEITKLVIFRNAYETSYEKAPELDLKKLDDYKIPYSNNGLMQFILLFKRSWINAKRHPIFGRVKYFQSIVFGIILALIYNDLGSGEQSIQNRNGALFMLSMACVAFGTQNASLTFPSERALYLKENKQNLYSTLPYYLAKTLSELPSLIIAVTLQDLIAYWTIGLNNYDASKFFILRNFNAVAASIMMNTGGTGLGYIIGSVCQTEQVAMMAEPMIIIPLFIYGGGISNLGNMPAAFSWIKYLSVIFM